MKLLSLVSVAAFVGSALASSASSRAWTITTANATKPDEVLGKHQDFVKVWTVKGSAPVRAIQLAAAGPVFIDYEGTLNTAATPAPTTVAPTTDAPTTEAPTEAPTTEAPTETPTTEAPTEAPTTQPPTTNAPSQAGSSALDGAVSFGAVENVVAKVVLSGNCTRLLDEFEVVEHSGALKIHFKNTDFHGYGFILTQIVVGDQAAVEKVSSSGSNSVYISEQVVSANGSAPAFSISGDGDVIVAAPTTDFTLEALDFKISGAGSIQFQAASVSVRDALLTKISGDATIAVVAKSISAASTLETKISGDGEVYYQAENVTAEQIVTKISGEGDVTISTNGTCVSQEISISGEGNVATASVLCQDTRVKLSGEGSVLVQTSGTLRVPHEIDGKVQYWGVVPAQITDGTTPRPPRPPHPPHPRPCGHKRHGWFWGWWDDGDDCGEDDDSDSYSDDEDDTRHLPKSVTAAPENTYKTYKLKDIPAREPTFLVLTVRENGWGSDPSERVVISIFGIDIDVGNSAVAVNAQQLAAHVHKTHGPVGAAALGVVAVGAVAAVGVAVHKAVMTRRRRREYQPLLQVVTN